MKLIKNYLHEVGRYLPEHQRDDILNELQSSLEEEIREETGTDEPTREQIEVVLNRYGHPINVASGYKEPRYLIGPELYPAFIESLSTIFTISFVIVVSLQLLAWVTQGWASGIGDFIENVIRLSLWLFAISVSVFATLEYYGERVGWYDNWKASSLSDAPPTSFSRSDLITNLITEGIFLLWWINVLTFQNWIPGLTEQFSLSLSPAWNSLYWPITIIVVTWFVIHAYTLLKRRWTRPVLFIEVASNVAALLLCVYLVTRPELITITGNLEGSDLLQRSIKVSVGVVGVMIAWDIWLAIKRLKD